MAFKERYGKDKVTDDSVETEHHTVERSSQLYELVETVTTLTLMIASVAIVGMILVLVAKAINPTPCICNDKANQENNQSSYTFGLFTIDGN